MVNFDGLSTLLAAFFFFSLFSFCQFISDRLYGELVTDLFIFHMSRVVKFVSFSVNGLNGPIKRKMVLTLHKNKD